MAKKKEEEFTEFEEPSEEKSRELEQDNWQEKELQTMGNLINRVWSLEKKIDTLLETARPETKLGARSKSAPVWQHAPPVIKGTDTDIQAQPVKKNNRRLTLIIIILVVIMILALYLNSQGWSCIIPLK